MPHVRHAGHKSRCYCWLLWRLLRPARACELCEESVPSIPVSPPRPRLRHSARRRDTRNILWSETHQCPELRGGFLILSIVMEGGVNDKCCLSIYSLQKSLCRYIHRRFESPCVLYQQSTFTIYILWYILLNVIWCVMMVWWFLFINVTEDVNMAWQDMQYLVLKKKKSLTDCRCDNMSPQTAGDSCVLCSKKATCKCSGCWQVSSV